MVHWCSQINNYLHVTVRVTARILNVCNSDHVENSFHTKLMYYQMQIYLRLGAREGEGDIQRDKMTSCVELPSSLL